MLIPFPSISLMGILPVVHPAALLRGTGNYRQFRGDIQYAFHLLNGGEPRKPIVPKYFVARNPFHVAQINQVLRDTAYIACDSETGGFNHLTDEILAIGLCADPKMVYIVPQELVAFLGPLFKEKGPRFIYQNGKFDMRFIRRDCSLEARVDEDTMLMSYALDEQGGIHDLETIANDLIGAPDYKHMLKPYLPKRSTSYRVIPRPVLYHYLALDTSNTLQVFHPLKAQVEADAHLKKLYNKVLLPASEFLYNVEVNGISILPKNVERQRKRLQKEIDHAYAAVQTIAFKAGSLTEVNPNSTKQLAVLLYDKLKLGPKKAGTRSTAKGILEKIDKHPAIEAVWEYRKAVKAASTYVVSLERNLNIDGRVHCVFLLHGTRTGRLSSRGPNMQNIPRDSRLRGMYAARPGYVFIKVDLNQAELRSLADLSDDSFLVPLYTSKSKRSLHKETADDFFGKGWNDEQLMRAKAVNFGIVYGREAPSLANEFDIDRAVAQGWINKWFARSPEAHAFIRKCRSAPLNNWTLITPFGRKKRHWIVTRENLNALQNEASNFPHQAIASDICLLGAAKAAPILKPYGILPVNMVHDEAMLECPDIPELIAYASYIIRTCMESIAPEWGITRVPFKAEASVGKRWNIYRKGPEYEYPYSPDNPVEWATPNNAVLHAIASRAADSVVLADKSEVAGDVEIPRLDDSGNSPDNDQTDADWSADDGATPWSPPNPSEPYRQYDSLT
jgi:DNA polymerase-1